MALLRGAVVPDVAPWRDASRAVVAAKDTYLAARGLAGAGAEEALQALIDRVDEMSATHDRDGLHQQRLIAVMLERTGAAPLESGLRPVKRFDKVLNTANKRLHGEAELVETCDLWDEAVGLLEQLFLPPKARYDELEQLAQETDVGPDQIERALQLLATPEHLQQFLARITVPVWFVELADRGLVEPTSTQGIWPGFRAVEALRATHPKEVLAVLDGLATKHHRDAAACWTIARAAHDLGRIGSDLVLRLAEKHRTSQGLVVLAIDVATAAEPTDELVERVADLALNYDLMGSRGHFVEELVAAFVRGVTPDNAARRTRLLCHKLRHAPAEDLDLRMLSYSNAPLEETSESRAHEPLPLLLGSLTEALRSAAATLPLDEVLVAVDELPEVLRARVRTWLLATLPEVPREVVVQELLTALRTREATGDDAALFSRLVKMGSVEDCLPEWRNGFGEPPETGELARGLANVTLDRGWLRVRSWSAVLPQEAWGEWLPVLALLRSAFGPAEDRFHAPKVEVGWGRSPMTVQDLQALPVAAAAERVAGWRPDADEMLVSARELGRALEEAVAADPVAWAERPLETAAVLHHPTYLAHYLRGLTRSKRLADINVLAMLDVIELVAAHPWQAVPLGRDNQFDYDPDWTAADDEGVAFIKAAAEAEASLGPKTGWAWNLVLSASRCETPNGDSDSSVTDEGQDFASDAAGGAFGRAINRSCTKALEAVVHLMSQAHRETGAVPSEALDELARVLELSGDNGLQHRAILAPRISFLHRVVPDWTEDHLNLMYGSAAPTGLADATLELTLRWSRPSRWFLETFAGRIISLAASAREQALEQALVAYLWGVPGYDLMALCQRLAAADLLSDSGEQLGRMLRGDPDPGYIQRGRAFWESALATGLTKLSGFGWFAEVEGLDDATWLDLTLRTIQQTPGQLDWAHAVAERAVNAMPSEAALGVLNALVRRLSEPWDRRSIGEQAAAALQAAGESADSPNARKLDTTLRERGFLT